MVNPDHITILKSGSEAWEIWRETNPGIIPDLYNATLEGADLRSADMHDAILEKADLRGADLRGAILVGANLRGADLRAAELDTAYLKGADLSNAIFGSTRFGDVDLSAVIGLESMIPVYQSSIGINTIYQSSGKIPPIFLRNCGIPDKFIMHLPSLVDQSSQYYSYYSCFISYCHNDEKFAKRLHTDLQDRGVRCWFAPEDMKIGDPVLNTVDNAVQNQDKLIIIFSKSSLESDWVEHEVNKALEEEKKRRTTVLFPLRIDDAVMETEFGWAKKIREGHKPEGRHIGNFLDWEKTTKYQVAFELLLRDLKTEE